MPNYNGNKYEITGGGTAVRNGSITLSTHYHTDGVGNGPVVVDQNSWKITQVKVKNGEVLPEPYTGIELYPTDTSVNISIDSAFYLEYMDKEIEISVNATVGGRPFANDKVFKVETVKLSKDIKGPKDIYAGSSEYSISLEGIKDGMNEELEKAGLSLVWEIKETKEYVTLGNSLDYGEKVLVNVDDDIDEEDTFKLKVVLKYNNKEYASTERGGLKAKANKPGGGGNGGGRP